MAVLKFVKTENDIGSKVIGKLHWDGDEYDVVPGGYGKGAIPGGRTTLSVIKQWQVIYQR